MTGIAPRCDGSSLATRPKLYSKIWYEGKSFLRMDLSSARQVDAVRIQDVAQGHDALQLVDVSTAHDRQDFDLVCAHALKRQIKLLVGVDVGKNARIHQFTQLLVSTFRHLSFEGRHVDNANHTSSIGHQPGSELTRADPFQGLPNRDLGWQQLGRRAHDSVHRTLTMSLAQLRRREVYAILHCQGFVDGLPLQS